MVAMARAAVCLCLWLAVSQVRGSYSRQEMNRTIQNLLQHYNIPIKEIFNGKLVFPRELPSGKMEEKMVYMSGVLETYEHLIDHMLKQLPAPSRPKTAANGGDGTAAVVTPATGTSGDAAGGDVREQLTYILDKVQKLRTHRYREQNQFLQALQALGKVQMKNSIIQSKALWELPWLYEEASSLPDNLERDKQKRRRRRQAQRVKTRQRA